MQSDSCVLPFSNKARIGFKTWRLRNWRTEDQNYNTQACNDNFLFLSFSQVKWKMADKNFVFVNENQFTWRSSQNDTLSYQLTCSESNRLIVSVICAWLSIKAISIPAKWSETRAAWSKTTEQQAAHRMKPSARGNLSGKCDWKSDRKCSTWRMRRRFAAVLI